jgi:hypothetical protein
VCYSEHSSFTELQHLVAALRPAKIIPTVNADSASAREKLVQQFAKGMDTSCSKRTLDYHFSRAQPAKKDTALNAPAATGGGAPREQDALESVDVAHQQRLWALLTSNARPPPLQPFPSADPNSQQQQHQHQQQQRVAGLAPAAPAPTSQAPPEPIAGVSAESAAARAQLCDVLGGSLPSAYVDALLADGHGDVEVACSIHFGANGGVVPPTYAAIDSAAAASSVALEGGPSDSHCTVASSAAAASSDSGLLAAHGFIGARAPVPAASSRAAEEELELPPGTVAWVVGKDNFRLYKSREALEARLKALGAAVISSGNRQFTKREVTLIVTPEGTEPGSIIRSACPNAPIVSESWVVKRAMALRAGAIAPAPPPTASAKDKGKGKAVAASKKRARSAADGGSEGGDGEGGGGGAAAAAAAGEKRAARFRSMSAAAAARMERALSERLYLIERRDESECSPSGLLSLRHAFAVLGSTGNVYTVHVCRVPSCTCVDFRERKAICKHLLFVYLKVLALDRESHVPLQKALLRSELADILTADGTTAAAGTVHAGAAAAQASVTAPPTGILASPAVVRAFRSATGRPGDSEEAVAADDDASAAAAAAAPSSPALVAPRPPSADEPCAICFDPIEEEAADEVLASVLEGGASQSEGTRGQSGGSGQGSGGARDGPPTSHCARGCGRVLHLRCMQRWFEARGPHARRECPCCRAEWLALPGEGDDGATAGLGVVGGAPPDEDLPVGTGDEASGAGLLNLGALQPGTRRVRDQSSYSEWLEVHQRRREQQRLAEQVAGASASSGAAGK